jgi:ligand-binding SRPBCC domain-containing protein
MTRIEYEENINAPVERVYEYYTNPDNIKEAWPRDVVKESESITDSKNEPGSEMKVKGEYMGRKIGNQTDRRTIQEMGKCTRISRRQQPNTRKTRNRL